MALCVKQNNMGNFINKMLTLIMEPKEYRTRARYISYILRKIKYKDMIIVIFYRYCS